MSFFKELLHGDNFQSRMFFCYTMERKEIGKGKVGPSKKVHFLRWRQNEDTACRNGHCQDCFHASRYRRSDDDSSTKGKKITSARRIYGPFLSEDLYLPHSYIVPSTPIRFECQISTLDWITERRHITLVVWQIFPVHHFLCQIIRRSPMRRAI